MNTVLPTYRLVAAAILLTMYFTIACILLYLLYHPPVNPPVWDQVLVIFNAIGAIATTAAGVLLGVEIQRENVVRADEKAEKAKTDAEQKGAAIRAALAEIDTLGIGGVAAGASVVDLGPLRAGLRAALSGPGDHL